MKSFRKAKNISLVVFLFQFFWYLVPVPLFSQSILLFEDFETGDNDHYEEAISTK